MIALLQPPILLLLCSSLCVAWAHYWAGFQPVNCTLDTCFNLEKCIKGFTIYVYPTPTNQSQPTCNIHRLGPDRNVFLATKGLAYERQWFQACATHTILSAGFSLTDNPAEACILFPTIEGCTLNRCTPEEGIQVGEAMKSLPYWNGGRSHVVWDYWTDHPRPAFDTGKAALVGGAMLIDTYRPYYDVLLPLTRPHLNEPLPEVEYAGHCVRRLLALNASAAAVREVLEPIVRGRDLLTTFKGVIYGHPGDHSCAYRSRIFGSILRPPVNESDIIIAPTCGQVQDVRSPHLQVAHCKGCVNNMRKENGTPVSCTAQWPDISFHDGLRRSKFAFSPSGCGPLSFRLSEGIGFGSIPILTGKGSFVPFAGETEVGKLWQQCVIHVPEEELPGLFPKLRKMGDEEYYGRLSACVQIAALKLHKLDVLVKQSICVIASRISSALQGKNWNDPYLVELCLDVGIGPLF